VWKEIKVVGVLHQIELQKLQTGFPNTATTPTNPPSFSAMNVLPHSSDLTFNTLTIKNCLFVFYFFFFFFFISLKKKKNQTTNKRSRASARVNLLHWSDLMMFKSHWKVKGQHAAIQIKFLTTVHADCDTCLYYPTCSYLSLFRCLPAGFNFSFHKNTTVSLLTYSWVCSCGTHSTVPHTQLFPFPSLLSVCRFLSCLGMLPPFSSVRMELFLTGQLNVRGHNAG